VNQTNKARLLTFLNKSERVLKEEKLSHTCWKSYKPCEI